MNEQTIVLLVVSWAVSLTALVVALFKSATPGPAGPAGPAGPPGLMGPMGSPGDSATRGWFDVTDVPDVPDKNDPEFVRKAQYQDGMWEGMTPALIFIRRFDTRNVVDTPPSAVQGHVSDLRKAIAKLVEKSEDMDAELYFLKYVKGE